MSDEYILVDTPEAFEQTLQSLENAKEAAVDVEADSLYRYSESVCLIQISIPGTDWIIDPLAIHNIGGLASFFNDTGIIKIFHDADFDLRSLDRDFGFRVRNIFDTKVAAELAGIKPINLSGLLERFCGIILEKKYQKYNWSRRPIPGKALRYAVEDSRHLLVLKMILEKELARLNRMTWAKASFNRLETIRWAPSKNALLGFRRMKVIRHCSPEQRAVLEAVWNWRDRQARRRNVPVFKVLSNKVIEKIVTAGVSCRSDLENCLPPGLRHKHAVIAGLWKAVRNAPEKAPDTDRETPLKKACHVNSKTLKRWRTFRDTLAADLGIEPHVLAGKKALEFLAANEPMLQKMRDSEIINKSGLMHWQWVFLKKKILSAPPGKVKHN